MRFRAQTEPRQEPSCEIFFLEACSRDQGYLLLPLGAAARLHPSYLFCRSHCMQRRRKKRRHFQALLSNPPGRPTHQPCPGERTAALGPFSPTKTPTVAGACWRISSHASRIWQRWLSYCKGTL